MDEDTIKPQYKVSFYNGEYIIIGTETTSGETVIIKEIPGNEKFLCDLAELLNRSNVSIYHAKDVIRDRIIALLGE